MGLHSYGRGREYVMTTLSVWQLLNNIYKRQLYEHE